MIRAISALVRHPDTVSESDDARDPGWSWRITAVAKSVRSLEDAAGTMRARRDELIVDAADAGCRSRKIADWAGLSQSQVINITNAGR